MKKFSLFLLGLTVLLAGCQGKTPATGGVTEAFSAPATLTVAPTETKSSPTPSDTAIPPGCTVVSPRPTPGPTEASLFPPASKEDWVKGSDDAAVTLIGYADFMDPASAALSLGLELLQSEQPKDVRIVFRHFPLISVHDKAALAAQAADAAGAQGKFWEMHDLLYKSQEAWKDFTVDQFQSWVASGAEVLGLDKEKFTADMLDQKNAARAQAAFDRGVKTGMTGTPFLLVNGTIWPDNLPMSRGNVLAVINLELLEKREFTACPPMTVDTSKQYIATLHTEKGDIIIELFADKAPLAVNNFIFLSRNGWYEGVTFHRVLPDFVAQGGDPSGTGFGMPGYAFSNETSPDLTFDNAGVFAMANAGPNSNGSQFFITLSPQPQLNGGYTIFGKVIAGLEVVKSLTPRDPSQGLDLPPGDEIVSIEIEER